MNFEVVLFILLVVAVSSGFAIDFIFVSLEVGEDRPAFLEYTAGFFPIILIVLLFDHFYLSLLIFHRGL